MHITKLGFTALLATCAASPVLQASEQSDSVGFIEGGKLTVKARNMYMQRDNRASGASKNYQAGAKSPFLQVGDESATAKRS